MPSRATLLNLSDYGLRRGSGHASVASGCLRAWALADGDLRAAVEVDYCHGLTADDPGKIARRIARGRPGLVGFSCYTWNMTATLRAAAALKKLLPAVRVVLGGPEAGGLARGLLKGEAAVDFIAMGEGEETFRLLLRHLFLGEGRVADVPGLAYRGENGEVVVTAEPPLIDLTSLPSPYLDGHVAMPPAAPAWLVLETSRGCPFSCTFCDWGPKKMRYRDLGVVEAEMRRMAELTEVIVCSDADLLMQRRTALPLMAAFLRAAGGRNTQLSFDANPMHLWPEIADFLATAPDRFHITFGLQSVVPEVAKMIQRPLDLPVLERRMDYFKSRCPSMPFHFSLIFGLPGDTLRGFRKTLEWVMRYRPLHICAHHCAILPGSELERQAAELKFVYQTAAPHFVLSTPTMSGEDFGAARRWSFLLYFVSSYAPLHEALFDLMDRKAREGVGRVDVLLRWAEFMGACGLDLTCGQNVTELGDVNPAEQALYSRAEICGDPLLLAAVMKATASFEERERPDAASRSAASWVQASSSSRR